MLLKKNPEALFRGTTIPPRAPTWLDIYRFKAGKYLKWLTALLVATVFSLPSRFDEQVTEDMGAWFFTAFLRSLTGILPIFLVAPVIIYYCWRWPFLPGQKFNTSIKLFLLFTLLVLVAVAIMLVLQSLLKDYATFISYQIGYFTVVIYVLPGFITIFVVIAFVSYIYIAQQAIHVEREAFLKTEIELDTARIQMLQNQLQPHFLFNALNSISAVMHSDIERADSMLAALGDFLRSVNHFKDRPFIELHEELGLVKEYLMIAKLRFGDRLDYEIVVEVGSSNFLVPSLLLQPLVENAVKYRFEETVNQGKITIKVIKQNSHLLIEVIDDGEAESSLDQGRIVFGDGLSNVEKRLKFLYPDQYEFEISCPDPLVTKVKIVIPADKLV